MSYPNGTKTNTLKYHRFVAIIIRIGEYRSGLQHTLLIVEDGWCVGPLLVKVSISVYPHEIELLKTKIVTHRFYP